MSSKIDHLVKSLKVVGILSEEEIASLKSVTLPSYDEIASFAEEPEVSAILDYFSDQPDEQMTELHKLAKQFIASGDPVAAWKVILQD